MKSKIGLLLSHIHVKQNEMYKFDMLEQVLSNFRDFDKEFFIVVSGHGYKIPSSIQKNIQQLYWEKTIDNNEIGRGHPKFCIEGYKILLQNDIHTSIKMRACDVIGNEQLLHKLLEEQKLILTEQTCFQKRMIGDLLMLGNTQRMFELWTEHPWDYNKSGLYNLFDNAERLANKQNKTIREYLRNEAYYVHPNEIQWYTLENNWNNEKKCTNEEFSDKHLWGANRYPYYGGF
tara:strand:- start:1261 stop:1956 length:696 start_codon:yes stop_codon:yes gene_type:complete